MDFDDSADEAAFRREARAWLSEHAEPRLPGQPRATPSLDEFRTWQRTKAAAGYAAITWPKAFGGRGGKPIEHVIYQQEEARFNVGLSDMSPFAVGIGELIPTLMEYGSAGHLQRYVKPALYGEEIWCQLFSEPAAGSDLAGIRTRAVRDGDDWVINGQKIWTSMGNIADFGMIVTRTDPTVPKHRGLTVFFVDMKSPGIEARPIRQADTGAHFCEVFLTDVRVPDAQRLGEPGDGWRVALTTLMHERNAFGANLGFITPEEVLELARAVPRDDATAAEDRSVRSRIADWYVDARGLQLTNYRALTALSKGQTPGPELSIQKLVHAAQAQELSMFAMDLFGAPGVLTSAVLGDRWRHVEDSWWGGAALRIAGGTDEIMRNIIAERVLGLPGDVRVDKNVPFNQLGGAVART